MARLLQVDSDNATLMHVGLGSTCSPRLVLPSLTMGDCFPAALSPAIWWKWLQNRIVAVVKPISIDATAAEVLTKAFDVWTGATCKRRHLPYLFLSLLGCPNQVQIVVKGPDSTASQKYHEMLSRQHAGQSRVYFWCARASQAYVKSHSSRKLR